MADVELPPLLKSREAEQLQLERLAWDHESKTATPRAKTGTLYDHTFKLVVIGQANVGKTSLLKRIAFRTFEERLSAPTIMVDFFRVSYATQRDHRTITCALWDTAGQERFRSATRTFYRGAHAILGAFDLTDRFSFSSLDAWLGEVQQSCALNESALVLIVGTKLDLAAEQRAVSTQEAQAFCDQRKFFYVETSSKDGRNVDELFAHVVALLYERETAAIKQKPGDTGAAAPLGSGVPLSLQDPTELPLSPRKSAAARKSTSLCEC